jgi:hypothetical protein
MRCLQRATTRVLTIFVHVRRNFLSLSPFFYTRRLVNVVPISLHPKAIGVIDSESVKSVAKITVDFLVNFFSQKCGTNHAFTLLSVARKQGCILKASGWQQLHSFVAYGLGSGNGFPLRLIDADCCAD